MRARQQISNMKPHQQILLLTLGIKKSNLLSENIKILHLDSNHPLLRQSLEAAGFTNDDDFTSPKAAIEDKIHEYDGIVLRSRFAIDQAFLDRAVKLKFIARVGAGLENIDTVYAHKLGIALIAAPEGNRNAVAEHSLGMLLSLFNNLNRADAEVRAGHWNRESNRGHELDGKTVGIIGYGNMGKAFAKKLRGFDVTVLCHDILTDVSDANATQVSLEQLQQQADVLSLHIPYTPETKGMVNRDFIKAFAKPFWLLNTSRGKNVVTEDLVAALESGKILGTGLDVLEYEKSSFEHLFEDPLVPPAFQYLLQSPRVLLSPHVAGWTFESHEKLAAVIADKILALYFGPRETVKQLPRATGIGGLFFKSQDPEALKAWYEKNLGLPVDPWGCTFWWKDAAGNNCSTQWSVMPADTSYFEPSGSSFMQNFRVNDLDALLVKLEAAGVWIAEKRESYEYGKFAWIQDPDGNKIELWEPADQAFL